MRKHALCDLLDPAHPVAQDVIGPVVRVFKGFDGFCADHAPVGYNANATDRKALFEPLDDGQKRGHIGGIAGPHLATDRLAFIVDDGADHHLGKIGPVVLAKASFADALSAATFEVDRGGIEKDQIQIRKKVPAMVKDQLLDLILVTAGSKWSGSGLVAYFFTQKAHGPIKVMKVQTIDALDEIITAPAAAEAVRT
jgi:hypothetical protein